MAQTGMEALEILRGIVRETKPDLVLVVDALAARSVERLNRTVQLTDTGICPGAGIGNNRQAINRESLGCTVIALGVPTVVDAVTIVMDSMETFLKTQGYTGRDAEQLCRHNNKRSGKQKNQQSAAAPSSSVMLYVPGQPPNRPVPFCLVHKLCLPRPRKAVKSQKSSNLQPRRSFCPYPGSPRQLISALQTSCQPTAVSRFPREKCRSRGRYSPVSLKTSPSNPLRS